MRRAVTALKHSGINPLTGIHKALLRLRASRMHGSSDTVTVLFTKCCRSHRSARCMARYSNVVLRYACEEARQRVDV